MWCARCGGPTTRVGLCGICRAVEFGMSDDDVDRALDALKSPRVREYACRVTSCAICHPERLTLAQRMRRIVP